MSWLFVEIGKSLGRFRSCEKVIVGLPSGAKGIWSRLRLE
jgi:hypothetical protein